MTVVTCPQSSGVLLFRELQVARTPQLIQRTPDCIAALTAFDCEPAATYLPILGLTEQVGQQTSSAVGQSIVPQDAVRDHGEIPIRFSSVDNQSNVP